MLLIYRIFTTGDTISTSPATCTVQSKSSPSMFTLSQSSDKPHIMTQVELNDFCRILNLGKKASKYVASRFKEYQWLAPNVKITYFRTREQLFASFFRMKGDLCCCFDVNGLMNALNIEYYPSDWRLFVDASSSSLKAVLLSNGNTYPSIPIAYSPTLKETFMML